MKLLVSLSFFLLGCVSTPPTSFESKKFYKKDMQLKINGKSGVGYLVLEPSDKYKIKITAKDKIHLLTVRNCHRSIEAEKAWKNNNFLNKLKPKMAQFEITPNSTIEEEYCPWDIGAWSISGRHSWGWIDFYTKGKYTLEATLRCDGSNNTHNGVSICQGFTGLAQEIEFKNKVEVLTIDPNCSIKDKSAKVFRFKIRNDICVYGFRDPITKLRHRLTTIGYKHIILRDL